MLELVNAFDAQQSCNCLWCTAVRYTTLCHHTGCWLCLQPIHHSDFCCICPFIGLLVLTLAKPTRITSIEVELVGRTMTAWPEGVCLSVCDPAPPDQRPGVGARRIEITEEHDIHSQTSVFFRAGHTPGSSSRRNLSVGPGLVLEHEDEDHSEQSSVMQPEGRGEERGRGRSPPRDPASARSHRRHMSVGMIHRSTLLLPRRLAPAGMRSKIAYCCLCPTRVRRWSHRGQLIQPRARRRGTSR